MNVKNKAKFVLSVFLIVSSILIVSAILFVAILFFTPSQTKADKKLDTIQSEVQELPLAMRYSTLVGEDLELNLDKVLENNGYNSYTDECLCFYEDKVYFVFSYMDDINEKRVWNIASVNFDGTNFEIEYSNAFDGFYYNEATNKNNLEKSGYFKNGVIVLNDTQKVVEYDILSAKSTEFVFDEYNFIENEIDYEIVDYNKITFTKNNVEKTLTLEELKKSNGAISEICGIYDKKTVSTETGLEYFFDSVQFVDGKVYLLCRVLNFGGHTTVVVLEYDFETNSCKYVCSKFISDVINGHYYLVSSMIDN